MFDHSANSVLILQMSSSHDVLCSESRIFLMTWIGVLGPENDLATA